MSDYEGRDKFPVLGVVNPEPKDPNTTHAIEEIGEDRILNLAIEHVRRAEYADALTLFQIIKKPGSIAEFYCDLCEILMGKPIEDDPFRSIAYRIIVNLIQRFENIDPRMVIPDSLVDNLTLASGVLTLATRRGLVDAEKTISMPIPEAGQNHNAPEIVACLKGVRKQLGSHLQLVRDEES